MRRERQTDSEPNNVQEAMASPEWKRAMDLEYSAFMSNQTWDLVPARKGINLIESKWVCIR